MRQDTILTLDYPVLYNIRQYSGVDAILNYMKCIVLEQSFLKQYNKSYVKQVLKAYVKGHRGLAENISEIVLQNILGHIFLGRKPGGVDFTEEECDTLSSMFLAMTKERCRRTV